MIPSNIEERSKSIRESIWKAILSLPKYFSPATKSSHPISSIDPNTASKFSSSSDMDIIEIDSSESDDDVLIGRDLPNNPPWNGSSSSNMPIIDRSNIFYSPRVNVGEEITSWTTDGSNAAFTQKRTLPPSFQSKTSLNSSRRKNDIEIPQHTQQEKHNFSYDEDLHIIDDHRNKNGINIPQHTQRRMLPPYLQKAGKLTESGQMNVPYKYESSNHQTVSFANMNDNINFGKQRVLPPSMMNGKHVHNPNTVSSYDVGGYVSLAEQRFSELDETAIYQEALQNLNQPNIEEDLPSGVLSVSLMKHQKIALAWMVHKEKSVHCAGGILADDQGLGKTLSTIALIQKQRDQQTKFTSNDFPQVKHEALNLDDDGDDMISGLDKKPFETNSKKEEICSTLAVCPALMQEQRNQLTRYTFNDLPLVKPEVLSLSDNGDVIITDWDKKPFETNNMEEISSTSMQASGNSNPAIGALVPCSTPIQEQRNKQTKLLTNDLLHIKPAFNLDKDGDALTSDLDRRPFKANNKREQIPSTSMRASGSSKPSAGTLVVCPASILRQWARELDEKVSKDAKLSVLIYHGGTRTKDPHELAKYDVIITTYAIVTNEVPRQNFDDNDDDREQKNLDYELHPDFTSKKRKGESNGHKGKRKKKNDAQLDNDIGGPLSRVRWFRVILDEAQTIKNHKTQVARACSGLRAKKRWCLSGTPIQNSIDDLYSYFRFLKYDPYCVYSSFCSMIKYPISKSSSSGYKKLHAVLRTMLLRRTKDTKINGEPIINLPSKSVFLKKAEFSPEERSFYLRLELDSRQQFKKYAAAGTVSQNYASILLMLLRLRQACDHPVLVKGYTNSDTVGKESLDKARKLSSDLQYSLLQKLEGFAICGVCSDPPEDAVVTMCGHVFCYQCVSERLTGDETTCPSLLCKASLSPSSIFSRTTLQISISGGLDNDVASSSGLSPCDEALVVERSYVSSKIKAVMEILNSLSNPCYNVQTNQCDGIRPNTEPVKAIVFSQWTGMLDLLELSLNRSSIQYRRLDGSMSLPSRDNAVKDFNTDPQVTVMIMSLKAGNLGLNMVAACHVILLDLWWNPTTEDQAVDRAHRIGQTRPVTVSRLTIKDTIEDRILALQEEKRKMVSSAFGEDGGGGRASKLTVEDLSYLFMV